MCQVTAKKTNASELLMTCRKHGTLTSKSGAALCRRDRSKGTLVCCLGGVRHRGGVSLAEALLRNVGTCIPMIRENSK
jgi:hypothetical protein